MTADDTQRLLDEQVQLLNEWGANGGWQTIESVELLRDLMQVRAMPDGSGRTDPATVNSQVRAFLLAIYGSQLQAPLLSEASLAAYESFTQKNIYFEQQAIDTVEDLDQLIAEYADKEDHLFRGLNEAKFMLYSSLQRNWILQNRAASATDHEQFLARLVATARLYAGGALAMYIERHGGDYNNDVCVLSILQHYGCPTPLLDWTYDFYVALYFAALGATDAPAAGAREIERYVSVYYLEEEGFAQSGLRAMVEVGLRGNLPLVRQVVQARIDGLKERRGIMAQYSRAFSDENMGRFVADDEALMRLALRTFTGFTTHICQVEKLHAIPVSYFSDRDAEYVRIGLENNLNVINQQGVFTWNNSPTHPIEHVVHEQVARDQPGVAHAYTHCFNINKALIPHLLQRLNEVGYTAEFIFPEEDQAYLKNLVWAIFTSTSQEFS